jgi:hypothetical protein
MMPRSITAVFCIFGLLPCLVHGVSSQGEATYVSFSVPGALGTFPMGINASIEVAGFYTISSVETRGFLRKPDGTITSFDVPGALATEPQAINAGGDITGNYTPPTGPSQGFLRYADGSIVILPGNLAKQESVSIVGINDFDEIAGDYILDGVTAFVRSRNGVFATLPPPQPVATGLNASGSVVGVLFTPDGLTGFVAHPDGYWASIAPAATPPCGNQTIPEAINASGTIAGTFTTYCPANTGGFVLSPTGQFTLFQPPGQLPFYHDLDLVSLGPPLRLVSIDDAGDIAGTYADAAGLRHGFVRNPYGTITSFDPPESKSTTVTGIGDGGAIAGYYQYNPNGTGLTSGFLRIP